MSPLHTINELNRIFDKLDLNGDGMVSLDELSWLLERIGVNDTGLDELKSLIGKTSLDRLDFLFFYDAIITEQNDLGSDDLAKAFKVYDLNGDGVISCEEIQSVLKQLGLWSEQLIDGDCRRMIERCLISKNSRT